MLIFILLKIAIWLLGCVVATVAFKYYRASKRPKHFPPGPPTLPFIGNLHQLPATKAFLQFHQWAETHGSIIGLKFGPQNVVVLNSWKHVRELFDKRGAKYSSRPENYVGNELICPNETHILLVPYGQQWRTFRKSLQTILNVTAVNQLIPIQNAEAVQTMHQLVEDPAGYYDHIRRYSTAVILSSVFGQRGATFDSPKVQALYHAQEQFASILAPGATPPVDAFPWLKYIPRAFAGWKRWAEAIQAEQRRLYYSLMQETRNKVSKGTGTRSFIERLFTEQEKLGLDDEHVAYLGGILMEAGSDTTASTLLSYILGILSNQDVLKKAQEEVDGICGVLRSPTFEDFDQLPYLRACMNETLRWRPVAPGGIPHMLTEDDTYEGYLLPKGTMVFANAWTIHREQAEYDRPESFVPERFLGSEFGSSKLADNEVNDRRRTTYSFGAGRRICPGQHLAENSLMLSMAKLTWGFDMSSTGEHLDWDVQSSYTDGFVFSPKKFPVSIKPRSREHERVIEKEFEAQRAVFARYED